MASLRPWLTVTAAMAMLLPGLGAAIYANPVQDQLVEGHTVYAVLEIVSDRSETQMEFAAAVAVLVQETRIVRSANRFPGVLWFNDQYLTDPTAGASTSRTRRIPCTGAVLAVNAGDPDPRAMGVAAFNDLNYVESYYITDPNDHGWNVDKWNISGTLVWTVALRDLQGGYSVPDDGTCGSSAYSDRRCGDEYVSSRSCGAAGSFLGSAPEGTPGRSVRDPGANGQPYRAVQYNALLYFFLEDLRAPGLPKNHTAGSADWQADASGCHSPPAPESQRTYPCPGGNDDREGNSHPYNPEGYWFSRAWDGDGNHGASADCDGDGFGEQDCHATRQIDLYYGVAAAPTLRNYRVMDVEGSSAPYHCHDAAACYAPVP